MAGVSYLTVMMAAYAAVFGACLASFACVLSDRIPRGEPFLGGRSRCVCGRQLRIWENVPVLGWVRTWGNARCCGAKVPVKYVLAELGGGVAGAVFGAQLTYWMQGGLAWPLVALSVAGAAGSLVWLVTALTWPPAPGEDPVP